MNKINYWANKKVLVTGASGFVGSHFMRELSEICELVVGTSLLSCNEATYKIDLRDLDALTEFCQDLKFDVLIHCAGIDGNLEFKNHHLVRLMTENSTITANILAASRVSRVNKTLIISSAEIYAKEAESPISEESDYRSHFNNDGTGYVYAKMFSEILAKLYRQQFNMDISVARPTNIYGPEDNFNANTSKVIPSIIKSAVTNKDVEIWGNGTQTRDFVYIEDLVLAVLNIVRHEQSKTFNISSGQPVSIKDLAEMIIMITGSDSSIKLLSQKQGGVKARYLDISKISERPYFKYTSLTDGLRKTVDWYRRDSVKCVKAVKHHRKLDL